MTRKEQADKIIHNSNLELLLRLLVKWSNLKVSQLAVLLSVSEQQINRWINMLKPVDYISANKGLNLVVYRYFPGSKIRLFSATAYAQRRLGILKEKQDGDRIRDVPRFDTKFNFYEVEHTDWCIKALIKETGIKEKRHVVFKDANGKVVKTTKPIMKIPHQSEEKKWNYYTARELGYNWEDHYKKVKYEIRGSEQRKPDLLVIHRDTAHIVCIEIENTPKSSLRMRAVMRSLWALGDYVKRFDELKIYANEKSFNGRNVYNKWNNLLPYLDEDWKPHDTKLLKLYEELENV